MCILCHSIFKPHSYETILRKQKMKQSTACFFHPKEELVDMI